MCVPGGVNDILVDVGDNYSRKCRMAVKASVLSASSFLYYISLMVQQNLCDILTFTSFTVVILHTLEV